MEQSTQPGTYHNHATQNIDTSWLSHRAANSRAASVQRPTLRQREVVHPGGVLGFAGQRWCFSQFTYKMLLSELQGLDVGLQQNYRASRGEKNNANSYIAAKRLVQRWYL